MPSASSGSVRACVLACHRRRGLQVEAQGRSASARGGRLKLLGLFDPSQGLVSTSHSKSHDGRFAGTGASTFESELSELGLFFCRADSPEAQGF